MGWITIHIRTTITMWNILNQELKNENVQVTTPPTRLKTAANVENGMKKGNWSTKGFTESETASG